MSGQLHNEFAGNKKLLFFSSPQQVVAPIKVAFQTNMNVGWVRQ
ncbi:hypothetical protein [Paenibacillus dendrobii]|nr:hypothetical protein [Paenibacillus dendrobii]